MYNLFHIEQDAGAIVLYAKDRQQRVHLFTLTDFHHYFYASNKPVINLHHLNSVVRHSSNKRQRDDDDAPDAVLCVQPELKQNIYYYKPGYTPLAGEVVRVVLSQPSKLYPVVAALTALGNTVFEDKKVKMIHRFLIEVGLSVGLWFEYTKDQPYTTLKVVPAPADTPLVPLQLLSYDIECLCGANGEFPKAERDPIIQISSVVGSTASTSYTQHLFTWLTTDPIEGATLHVSSNEHQMLLDWQQFIRRTDPDTLLTFNGNGFDNKYIFDRVELLQIRNWDKFGRVQHRPAYIKTETFESAAYGRKTSNLLKVPGRVHLDVCEEIRRNYGGALRSYTLNACAANWLNSSKDDLHHSLIRKCWLGTNQTRARLGRYCIKDALLTLQLQDKLKLLLSATCISRVSRVTIDTALSGGQQIKSTILVAAYAFGMGYVCGFANPANNCKDEVPGALVLPLGPRWIVDPVATFDFNSLYPSLICAYNMCWTTWVHPTKVHLLRPEDYVVTPTKDVFVRPHIRQGLLPTMLNALLKERGDAKKMMAAASTPEMRAVYDKLQDALKRENNSKYGYTGVGEGHLPCIPVARSTTTSGRAALQKGMDYLRQKFPQYEIVYGDTDSLFVRMEGLSLQDAWDLMHVESELMTKTLFGDLPPMRFAPEKMFDRLLTEAPKRYAGRKHQGRLGNVMPYFRGIEIVRRDWCPLVSDTMKQVFDYLFADQIDVAAAVTRVRQVVTDLFANRIELSQLLLSQGLSKETDEYSSTLRHTAVVEKMRARDADTAPTVGTRVTYVMVDNKGRLASQHSEDPLFVIRNNLPIDTKYYAYKQLEPPLTRVLLPVIGADACRELFHGAHTLKRVVTTQVRTKDTSRNSLVNHFVVVSFPCVICRTQTRQRPYCEQCRADSAAVQAFQLAQRALVQDIEASVGQAEAHCRSCQQISADEDIECEARDCPHLYTRLGRKAKLETELSKLTF